MKQNKNELDVDFIGGFGPLTKAEEKAITQFIKGEKIKRVVKKKQSSKSQKSTRTKQPA